MTDQSEPTPAVWDPTARDGAGGWVRRPAAGARPAAPADDSGPALTARPYLQSFLDAPAVGSPSPTPPANDGHRYPPPPPLPPPYPQLAATPPQPQPYAPGPDPAPTRRSPLLLGAGILLLLAVGGGAVLALQSGGGAAKVQPNAAPPASASQHPVATPSTPGSTVGASAAPSSSAAAGTGPSLGAAAGPNALSQAQALDGLLTRGEAAKAPIGNAVAMVASCPSKADIDSAAQVLDTGATQRDQLLTELGKLSFSDLPGGSDAAQSLRTAWQQSEDVDRSYAAWARTVSAQGCGTAKTAPSTPDKQHADDLNPQATQSKQDFVAKWNALASTYGLAARTWDRI